MNNLRNYISKIFYILPKGQSFTFLFIIILTLINTIFELLGIGLIIPFLSLFFEDTNSKFIENLSFLNDFSNENKILFILFLLLIVFILKNFFLLFFHKKKINFSQDLAALMADKLYRKYIRKNYIYFTNKNSSELIRNITGEANLFALGIVFSLIGLMTDSIIFISILCFLFVYNFKASLIATLTILSFGFVIMFLQQKKLKAWGKVRMFHSNALIKLIQETIGNIKEVILYNNYDFLINKFTFHTKENAKAGKKKDFFFVLPRPILEVVVVFMMIILVYIFVRNNQSTSEIFIIIGVFSFASIKLIPSTTNILRSLQGLRYNAPSMDKLYEELKNDNYEYRDIDNINLNKVFDFKEIELKNVSFGYPDKKKPILSLINLKIIEGEKIGFLGETGSGKTTLVNLIAGLVEPTNGEILINGENINKNLKIWQNNIGYVSQSIYLADESFEFNISFKNPDKKKNMDRINHLIDILGLKTFINSQIDGLSTKVGEKGIKISGGQLQRIGIARALYSKPNFLILDEATNALDLETQDLVINNIYKEMDNKTVLSISHDINALQKCSKIFKIIDNKLEIVKK